MRLMDREHYTRIIMVIITIGIIMFSKAIINIGFGLAIIHIIFTIYKNNISCCRALKDYIRYSKEYLFFVCMLLGWWFLSAEFSHSTSESIHIALNYFKWFICIYVGILLLKCTEIYSQKIIVYTMCVIGIFIFLNLMYVVFVKGSKFPYAVGVGHPNPTAAILIVILPFILFTDYFSGWVKKISSFLIILSVIITGSRGAMIALVISMFYGFILYYKEICSSKLIISYKKVITVLMLLFCCFFIIDAKMNIINDFKHIGKIYHEIDSGNIRYERLLMWRSSMKMIEDYPLFGVGLGEFNDVYTTEGYISKNAKEPELTSPHNIFIHLCVETGILGGLIFLALIIYQLITTYSYANISKFIFAWHLAIVGMCVHGMVDYIFMGRGYFHLYFFISTIVDFEIGKIRYKYL